MILSNDKAEYCFKKEVRTKRLRAECFRRFFQRCTFTTDRMTSFRRYLGIAILEFSPPEILCALSDSVAGTSMKGNDDQ